MPFDKIPVFVSCPSELNAAQEKINNVINSILNDLGFERRAVGKMHSPVLSPLVEVKKLAKNCAGGLILGFEQIYVNDGTLLHRRGTSYEKALSQPYILPTPWNQLEAGLLFELGLPLLIFREAGIRGGIFSEGTSGYFVHDFPEASQSKNKIRNEMYDSFTRWAEMVRNHIHTV